MGRKGRRRKLLPVDCKETREYWKLKGLENSLWKMLWTYRKTEYGMNEIHMHVRQYDAHRLAV